MLFFAALTSMISLMQVPVSFLEEEFKMSKKNSVILTTVVMMVCGLPALLAWSTFAGQTIWGMNYFVFTDYVSITLMLPINALFIVAFILFAFTVKESTEEFKAGAKNPNHVLVKAYPFVVTYIAPVTMFIIFLFRFGIIG